MIRRALVFAKEKVGNRDAAIRKLVKQAAREGLLNDEETFIASVYRREKEVPTSLGHGIAIPHGKSATVKEAFFAFLSVDQPFLWQEGTEDMVRGIFLIGVPEKNTERLHLQVISAISKRLLDEKFREALFNCSQSESAYAMLKSVDESIQV